MSGVDHRDQNMVMVQGLQMYNNLKTAKRNDF